jgi:ribosome-binding protein aMBF1 (putative translation factor)
MSNTTTTYAPTARRRSRALTDRIIRPEEPAKTADNPRRAVLDAFGARVRLAREHIVGLNSAAALSRVMAVDEDTACSWERGRSLPKPQELVKLRTALGVTLDWLLAGDASGLHPETKRAVALATALTQARRARRRPA